MKKQDHWVGFLALPIGNCVLFDNFLELLGLFILICEKEENDTVFQKQPSKDGLEVYSEDLHNIH